MKVNVIGAGLAGVEAAYFLANKGIKVRLFEMRPIKTTEAHHTDKFGELVCSNTLGSFEITTGAGLLKKEMELLNSLVVKAAKHSYVKAGSALAVDRNIFSDFITKTILSHPNIEIVREEVECLNENELNIVATGPLT
ncbi:MAG: FADH(2)-oxidizing methylenetetrahydrofolate--tRNA-(uracil(54)-C(5))-methyltransferase TrmFO, partial [Hydrogenobaculum sp.]